MLSTHLDNLVNVFVIRRTQIYYLILFLGIFFLLIIEHFEVVLV